MSQQPKADCFAFLQGMDKVDCQCLSKLYCSEGKGKCNFYMKKEDYEKKHNEEYSQTLKKLDLLAKNYKYGVRKSEVD